MEGLRWKLVVVGMLGVLALAGACDDDDDDKKCDQNACVDCLDNLSAGDNGTSNNDDPLAECNSVCDACGL